MKHLSLLALLTLATPVHAEDFSINVPLVESAHLPKKGTATYDGTYELTGGFAGTSGPIQIFVDFATGEVAADLTIPSLTPSGGATSPPEHYTPSGVISRTKKTASYTLTQGVSFSADEPFISLSGSFSGARARNTMGSFDANFCVEGCDTGAFVVRSVTGTFSARRP